MARLIAPMMPHLAEEMWPLLRPARPALVAELPWLEADPALLAAETVTVAVQVLGKLRATIEVPVGAEESAVLRPGRSGGERAAGHRRAPGPQAHPRPRPRGELRCLGSGGARCWAGRARCGVSGCGFRPLYAPVSTEDGGTADIRGRAGGGARRPTSRSGRGSCCAATSNAASRASGSACRRATRSRWR